VLKAAKSECSSVESLADFCWRSPCIFPAAEKMRSTPAEEAGIESRRLWRSAGQAPSRARTNPCRRRRQRRSTASACSPSCPAASAPSAPPPPLFLLSLASIQLCKISFHGPRKAQKGSYIRCPPSTYTKRPVLLHSRAAFFVASVAGRNLPDISLISA
jgi:hypothetical protein